MQIYECIQMYISLFTSPKVKMVQLHIIVHMYIIITTRHALEVVQIVHLLCQMLCTACRPSAAVDDTQ